jgi:hypothetical protein
MDICLHITRFLEYSFVNYVASKFSSEFDESAKFIV